MKILLIDDHALFRAGLRLLLGVLGNGIQVLETDTIAEALTLTAQHPDLQLCLLDLNLRDENGLDALHKIKAVVPTVSIVIVSANHETALIRHCLDAGAMSYIAKSAPPEVLTEALKCVLSGAVYLPSQLLDAELESTLPLIPLSPRQQDVLRGLCRGMSTKSIARELSLSDHTVKEYLATLFRLLGVHSRTEAVIKAGAMNLLLNRGR